MPNPDQRVSSPAEEHAARLARYEQALTDLMGIGNEVHGFLDGICLDRENAYVASRPGHFNCKTVK